MITYILIAICALLIIALFFIRSYDVHSSNITNENVRGGIYQLKEELLKLELGVRIIKDTKELDQNEFEFISNRFGKLEDISSVTFPDMKNHHVATLSNDKVIEMILKHLEIKLQPNNSEKYQLVTVKGEELNV